MAVGEAVRRKIDSFRIKELKDALAQLGLSRTGKKQVLLDRLLACFSDNHWAAEGSGSDGGPSRRVGPERATSAVDQVYRQMRTGGSPEPVVLDRVKDILARISKDRESNGSLPSKASAEREAKRGAGSGGIVRCPCGSVQQQPFMVQCQEPQCGALQHGKCLGLAEGEKVGAEHLCEVCRLAKSDPFLVTVAQPMPATKLRAPLAKTDSLLQQVERSFTLSRAQAEQVGQASFELQAWAVLLNDTVPLRCHWPAYADLRINGLPVRVTNRMGQQKLGQNGRDEGPMVSGLVREGVNRLSFSCYDDRPFAVGVRVVQRRSLEQVLQLVPPVAEGESFEEALARVKRAQGAGGGADSPQESGSASESEEELVTLQAALSLRCPMSGSRMKVPGRFRGCQHIGCFDLHTLIQLNQRARKWQCPICMRNSSAGSLYIDPYFDRLLSLLRREWDEDVTDVEIAPDGSWRAFPTGDAKKRAGSAQPRWHRPDETLDTWRPPSPGAEAGKAGAAEATTAAALPKVKLEEGASSGGAPVQLKIRLKRDRTSEEWALDTRKQQKREEARPESPAPPGAADAVALPSKRQVVIDLSDSDEDTEAQPIASAFQAAGSVRWGTSGEKRPGRQAGPASSLSSDSLPLDRSAAAGGASAPSAWGAHRPRSSEASPMSVAGEFVLDPGFGAASSADGAYAPGGLRRSAGLYLGGSSPQLALGMNGWASQGSLGASPSGPPSFSQAPQPTLSMGLVHPPGFSQPPSQQAPRANGYAAGGGQAAEQAGYASSGEVPMTDFFSQAQEQAAARPRQSTTQPPQQGGWTEGGEPSGMDAWFQLNFGAEPPPPSPPPLAAAPAPPPYGQAYAQPGPPGGAEPAAQLLLSMNDSWRTSEPSPNRSSRVGRRRVILDSDEED